MGLLDYIFLFVGVGLLGFAYVAGHTQGRLREIREQVAFLKELSVKDRIRCQELFGKLEALYEAREDSNDPE